jgi:hypothetical protein
MKIELGLNRGVGVLPLAAGLILGEVLIRDPSWNFFLFYPIL